MTASYNTKPDTTANSKGGEAQPVQPHIAWGEPQIYTPQTLTGGVSATHTESGNAESVIFDKLTLTVPLTLKAEGDTQALSATQVATLHIPITVPEDKPFLGYLNVLKGSIIKDKDSRAIVLADLAGTIATFEFPYDEELSDGLHDFKSVFSLEQRPPANTGAERSPLPPYVLTLVLSIQRRTADSSVSLSIDSLDIVPVIQ